MLAAVWLLGILVLCLYYLAGSYETLKRDYLSLNDCIYRSDSWAADFFSPATKAKGNGLAVTGLALAGLGLWYIIRGWKRLAQRPPDAGRTGLSAEWRYWYLAPALLALLSGLTSLSVMAPSYDEVFSAVNCAELHPFQTLTYYMLPNNHIYFNLVNNLLFGWLHHPVATGKVLSWLAYAGALTVVYRWLLRRIRHPLMALAALLPVALQFGVWGFATQARAYEWQLFLGWIAFTALLWYVRSRDPDALRLLTLANILALALIPTYVYVLAAQVVFLACIMGYRRQLWWEYPRYLLLCGAFVWLLYLPAFLFSGMAAFTDNVYVRPIADNWIAYLPAFTVFVRDLVNYCFSMLGGEDHPLNYALFFVPLLLFFFRDRERRLIAFFYVLLWLVFVVMTLHMRRHPFMRNMILHFSITMACVVYTFYAVMDVASRLLKSRATRSAFLALACALPLVLYAGYLYRTDRRNASANLYFNNTNEVYAQHRAEMAVLPAGSSIGFSAESFYCYYICREGPFRVQKCRSGNETYYLKRTAEPLPADVAAHYKLLRPLSEQYELYQRN